MEIRQNYPLLEHNTFRVDAKAEWWVAYSSLEDLDKLARDEFFRSLRFVNLGGGSNVLFLGDYPGAVLHSQLTDLETKELPPSSVSGTPSEICSSTVAPATNSILVRVGSGFVWDEFVRWSLAQGYYGLENLSGIPGSVGASAVQNIGAYGCEASQFIEEISVFDFQAKQLRHLKGKECEFAYRSSIFKTKAFEETTITHVTYRLSRYPRVNLGYKALSDRFTDICPTPQEIRETVLQIRGEKLPDPEALSNAGSFFKNPVVLRAECERLRSLYPEIPTYPAQEGDDFTKLSAAWLIDRAGFKGGRNGFVGCHEKHSLVVVNYGTANGQEIADFAAEVVDEVNNRFGITLEPEVRYIKGKEQ